MFINQLKSLAKTFCLKTVKKSLPLRFRMNNNQKDKMIQMKQNTKPPSYTMSPNKKVAKKI